MKHFLKYLLFFAVIIAACDSGEEIADPDQGYDYFPLRTGLYQLYHVDEIRYSPVAEPDTLDYEMIYEVVDSFQNNARGITYVIYRSVRENAQAPWQFLNTWSTRFDDDDAICDEGSTSYVKLAFPLQQDKHWDGNKLNNLEADVYEIIAYDEPLEVNEKVFDHTLTVEQEFNDDPIVYTDKRKEVYARGVGLIYLEKTQLRFCQEQTCAGDELIESGVILKQALIDYGIR